MYYILAGFGGVIVGYLIATVVEGGRKRNAGFESRGNSRQLKENLEKLRIFAQSKNEFTNQDVELVVADKYKFGKNHNLKVKVESWKHSFWVSS